MLLLHVSDIHFNRDFLSQAGRDPDGPIRTQLIRHARQEVQHRGPVDAILFTGDIAFRGATEEYEAASAWLGELAIASQCKPDRIFVVPGNHDVDQQVLRTNTATHNAQIAIDTAPHPDVAFRRQTATSQAAGALFASLDAYNVFAKKYKCELNFEQVTWVHDLAIDEVTTLRLHGIVSCLLSGLDPAIDSIPGRQYINRTQIAICPEDNVVNATLCHHPPHWFRNVNEVNSLLRPSARLQFFGHIHDQQIESSAQSVRILAGALVPAYVGDSQPAYNFIRLIVADRTPHKLNIEVSQFEWQLNPPRFRSKEAEDGQPIFQYTVPIDRAPGSSSVMDSGTGRADQAPTGFAMPTVEQVPGAQEMSLSRWRETIDAFHNLPSSARRDIARTIGVLAEPEFALPETERERITIERVRERGLQISFGKLIFRT